MAVRSGERQKALGAQGEVTLGHTVSSTVNREIFLPAAVRASYCLVKLAAVGLKNEYFRKTSPVSALVERLLTSLEFRLPMHKGKLLSIVGASQSIRKQSNCN